MPITDTFLAREIERNGGYDVSEVMRTTVSIVAGGGACFSAEHKRPEGQNLYTCETRAVDVEVQATGVDTQRSGSDKLIKF